MTCLDPCRSPVAFPMVTARESRLAQTLRVIADTLDARARRRARRRAVRAAARELRRFDSRTLEDIGLEPDRFEASLLEDR